ncbi:hypothetical protein C8R46DRAFT_1076302 [Mycena filopes]|nr:hypothetical protein C8R46DRAFT_1076302 [Mycena filopes]
MSSAQRATDRARIEQIETEISKLQDLISALRNEQAVIEERLNLYRYPASTLPTELVCEIFKNCLPTYPVAPPLIGPTSPTLLTQICRHWRAIALATPALWCAFRLDGALDEERLLQTVKAWLDRSGRRPLSIQMDVLEWMPDAEFVRALVRERARWEYVTLHATLEELVPFDGSMPHLRHLELQVPPGGVPESPVAFQPHQVPSLRTLTLWDWTYPTDILPWSQLRSLSLICKSADACATILTQTVNLVHCELVLSDDGWHTPLPDVHLPHLRSLVLGEFALDSDPDAYVDYLQTFVVPALRCLQIPEYFLVPEPIAALTFFVAKAGCTLNALHITGPRSLARSRYRKAFPDVDFTFNEQFTDWLNAQPASREREEYTWRSMTDFERGWA